MSPPFSPDMDGMGGRADDIYEALLKAHAGLSDAQSIALNARLILLLCNALSNPELALSTIDAARRELDQG